MWKRIRLAFRNLFRRRAKPAQWDHAKWGEGKWEP